MYTMLYLIYLFGESILESLLTLLEVSIKAYYCDIFIIYL